MTTTSISLVNTGSTANDGTGDSIRSAFQTVNNNFSYLTSYVITTAVNNAVVSASGVRKFVANGSGTIGNLWISVPSVAADAQELQITSLVPITNCFINQSGTPVMWVSNNFFSTGNVTATLTYSTTNNRWMKF